MKMILLFLCLISSLSSFSIELKDYEKKIKNIYSIKTVIDKISKQELEETLQDFIMKTRPSRVVGSKGHVEAQKFITDYLARLKSNQASTMTMDFNPDVNSAKKMYEDDFNQEIVSKINPNDPNYKRWKDFTISMIDSLNKIQNLPGKNIIWEKKGTNPNSEVLIIGANYDTLNHDPKTMKIDMTSPMPGADNNGTGVVMLLKMAEILSLLDIPMTVRLVFFDDEEFGFLGSKAYVEKLALNKNEKIKGYINLVMLGNDSKIQDTAKKYSNMKVYLRDPIKEKEAAQADLNLATPLMELGKKMYPIVDFELTPNGMNSSSHIRFWEAHIPSICFSENWETDFNPRFHTPNDFAETLNMNTFYSSFKYITSSLLALNYGIVK